MAGTRRRPPPSPLPRIDRRPAAAGAPAHGAAPAGLVGPVLQDEAGADAGQRLLRAADARCTSPARGRPPPEELLGEAHDRSGPVIPATINGRHVWSRSAAAPMDSGWYLQAQFAHGTTFIVQAPDAFTQEEVLRFGGDGVTSRSDLAIPAGTASRLGSAAPPDPRPRSLPRILLEQAADPCLRSGPADQDLAAVSAVRVPDGGARIAGDAEAALVDGGVVPFAEQRAVFARRRPAERPVDDVVDVGVAPAR